MKNIYEILKENGIEVPEDKKEDFAKALNENYKTIAEYNGINDKLTNANTQVQNAQAKYKTDIEKRDTDLANLKQQLQASGVDKAKLDELTGKLSQLQTEYDTAKTEYASNLAKQKYEYAVRELANQLKFTSNSAKKTFMQDVIAKNLPMENDSVLGFQDFVDAYKDADAGAFVVENTDNNAVGQQSTPPHFSGKAQQIQKEEAIPEKTEAPTIW